MIARALILLAFPTLCATGLAAQDTAAPAAPALELRIDPPWNDITAQWIERRYKVEAIRFKARDETGIDWLGSDEVMVETRDAKGFTVTDEIGDIDSGDTHEFDPALSCIIGVRPGKVVLGKSSVCDEAGEPGPFSFEVVFWEKDSFALDVGICNVVGPTPGHHIGAHCPNDGRGDDFIGRRALFFPLPDLEGTLPNVGDSFTETVVLSPCEGETDACGGWDLPDYTFTYRTTRLPDFPTDFRDRLTAAMRLGGIAVATDAVAAGLRLLTAPVDRRAEAEPAPGPTLAGR